MKKKRGRQARPPQQKKSQHPPGRRRELSKREYIQAENAKRHRKQRKRRQRLVLVLLLLFVLASAAVITSAVFFKIAAVHVTGDTGRYSSDQLISASGIVNGNNMFSFKSGAIENTIESAFPYLENVKVRRKLPSVVEISVQPAQPARAYRGEDNRYTLVSASGKVLETGAAKPENVLEIAGLPLQNVSAGQYLDSAAFPDLDTLSQIVDALAQWGIEGTQNIDISDKFNIRIKYNEKVSIIIGSVSQIPYKLQFVKYVLDNGLKENETVVIDASTAGQAVVKPVDSAASSSNASSQQTEDPVSSAPGNRPDTSQTGSSNG